MNFSGPDIGDRKCQRISCNEKKRQDVKGTMHECGERAIRLFPPHSLALRFSYIGRTQLANDYGILPLYYVKRARRGSTRKKS